MSKNKKGNIITVLIILAVILLAGLILNRPSPDVPKDLAKCIGEKTELYIQLGCHACETQLEMFGENKKHLNVIDCFFEKEKCTDIKYTPTWKIQGQDYSRVFSIEELKRMIKC